jgi:hypothetical protein
MVEIQGAAREMPIGIWDPDWRPNPIDGHMRHVTFLALAAWFAARFVKHPAARTSCA